MAITLITQPKENYYLKKTKYTTAKVITAKKNATTARNPTPFTLTINAASSHPTTLLVS